LMEKIGENGEKELEYWEERALFMAIKYNLSASQYYRLLDIMRRRAKLQEEKFERKLSVIAKRLNLSEEQYRRLLETLKKYSADIRKKPRIVCSFKEFLFAETDARVGLVLDKNGIMGWHRGDYLALARAIMKDTYEKIFFVVSKNKERTFRHIINYNVYYFLKRVNLDKEVIKQIITALYSIFYEYPLLKAEFYRRAEKEGLPFVYVREQT